MVVEVLFYIFAALAVIGALMVVTSRNPVRAVISLIFTFIAAACVWMLLEVEFLALVLIVVYVGAVMVLFMFVVMMIDVRKEDLKSNFVKYWPFSFLMALAFLALLVWSLTQGTFGLQYYPALKSLPPGYSSIHVLGVALYSHYLYAFIAAAMILLIAMIAAITLTFRGRRPGVKGLSPAEQIKADPATRLRMVSLDQPKGETGA